MTERIDLTEEGLARIAARAIELYALKHPRPTQVTQTQAAEMLGVTRKTVYSYIRAGKLRLNECGQVPIEMVDAIRAPQ
jgi:predicted DNA-binding protein (UPF0251 family)